uniref:Uncharacterized protein n=1 Tax=Phaeomonas parva TaxID=124430 RepID=A0A7S1UER0_9STRA
MEDNQSSVVASVYTLDEDTQQRLIGALETLGVMYNRAGRVLVLPSESESLRHVVYVRYIQSEEMLETFHLTLARFFQKHPQDLRRCEELPWHLQVCRKWTALKDCISDLRTFELMTSATTLKTELLEYWKMLTTGPLWISEEEGCHAAKRIVDNQALQKLTLGPEVASAGQGEAATVLLAELDAASVKGLTEHKIKQERLRGKVAPFDIVNEYNRQVEAWCAAARPNTSQVAEMLDAIGKFIGEFSFSMGHAIEKTRYPFLRPAIQSGELKKIGVDIRAKDTALEDGDAIIGGGAAADDGTESAANGAVTTNQCKPSYFVQRWTWVQFPWIALADAAKAARTGLYATGGPGGRRSLTTDDTFPSMGERDASGEDATLGNTSTRRYWEVKKQDPSCAPLIKTTRSRVRAHQRDLKQSRSLDTLRTGLSVAQSDFRRKKQLINDPLKPLPTRGQREPTLDEKMTIPFSQSTKRSQRFGSRFPSVEVMHQKDIENAHDRMDDFELEAADRFGGQHLPEDLGEVLQIKQEEEIFSNGTFPLSQHEASRLAADERLSKVRDLYNKYHRVRQERRAQLQEMRRSCEQRIHQDVHTTSKVRAGERIMEALEERLMRMGQAVHVTQALGGAYEDILNVCKVHPARDEQRLAMLEQQVKLVRQQAQDLLRRRQEIYTECDEIGTRGVEDAQAEVDYYRAQRTRIAPRIEDLKRRIQRAREREGLLGSMYYPAGVASSCMKLFGGGRTASGDDDTPVNSLPPTSRSVGSKEESSATSPRPTTPLASQPPDSRGRRSSWAAMVPSQAITKDGPPLQRMQDALQYLEDLVGTNNSDELIEKYTMNLKLIEDLKDQQHQFEARTSELKAEHATIQLELEELKLSGGADAEELRLTHEVRKFEKLLNREEIRLAQTHRKVWRADGVIEEVRAGVLHLAHLVTSMATKLSDGREANSNPQFRPHEEFDELDLKQDLWRLLSSIEDRVVSMSEASVLDSTKQLGEDGRRTTLEDRQNALVDYIETTRHDAIKQIQQSSPDKSRVSMNSLDAANSLISSATIHVLATDKVDVNFEHRMDGYLKGFDERAAKQEADESTPGYDSTKGMTQFLREALDTHESKMLLRRANVHAKRKQGKVSGFGLAIEDMLMQTDDGSRALQHARKTVEDGVRKRQFKDKKKKKKKKKRRARRRGDAADDLVTEATADLGATEDMSVRTRSGIIDVGADDVLLETGSAPSPVQNAAEDSFAEDGAPETGGDIPNGVLEKYFVPDRGTIKRRSNNILNRKRNEQRRLEKIKAELDDD